VQSDHMTAIKLTDVPVVDTSGEAAIVFDLSGNLVIGRKDEESKAT